MADSDDSGGVGGSCRSITLCTVWIVVSKQEQQEHGHDLSAAAAAAATAVGTYM